MNQLATYLDTGLMVLFALTIGLAVYKFLDIFLPGLLFRPSIEAQAQGTEAGLEDAVDAKEWGLGVLSEIAATAPFIGLAGTVMHIIEALQSLQGAAMDVSLLYGPLATAMYSTLWGLASAIPAAIAYNVLSRNLEKKANRVYRQVTKGE